MWQIIMRNWDLREFRVQVKLQSPIQYVWALIQHVLWSICGLSNSISQDLPLISPMRSYAPHLVHFHSPSLVVSSTTTPLLQNTKLSHPSVSLHVMIMNWHQVQHTPSTWIDRVKHTPSTTSSQDRLSSLHSHDYELTPGCSFNFWCSSLYDWPPSASSPSELKGKVTLSHSNCCKLSN